MQGRFVSCHEDYTMCGNVKKLLATRRTRKSFCKVGGKLRTAVQDFNIALRSQNA